MTSKKPQTKAPTAQPARSESRKGTDVVFRYKSASGRFIDVVRPTSKSGRLTQGEADRVVREYLSKTN